MSNEWQTQRGPRLQRRVGSNSRSLSLKHWMKRVLKVVATKIAAIGTKGGKGHVTQGKEEQRMRAVESLSNGNPPGRNATTPKRKRPEADAAAPYYIQRDDGTRVEIIAAARAAGWENLPETSAMEPDEVELALQREYQHQHRDALEQARDELRSLSDEFDRLEREMPMPQDLEVAVESAAADIERELSNSRVLEALSREHTLRQRDLRKFRRENGISRDAIYPASRLRHLAFLAPILLLESVANAGFFALGSEVGWLGGWAVAASVSGINIVVGAMSGYFSFRWRHHPRRHMQRVATCGVALYAVVAVLFNLAVARFRDAAITTGATQAISPDQLMDLSQPLSVASIALFLIGLIASGLSCWKGYRADDPVPGHGDRHRRLREADEKLREERDRQHGLVLGHAESVPERCRLLLRGAGDALVQMGDIVVRAERCGEGYDVQLQRVRTWSHQWLKKYRDENSRIRSTAPPEHFSEYPQFAHELDISSAQCLAQRLAFNSRRFQELKAAVHRIELGQPERVHTTHERFEEYWSEAVRRADSCRDGHLERASNGKVPSHV
jgi:hypothetical protein